MENLKGRDSRWTTANLPLQTKKRKRSQQQQREGKRNGPLGESGSRGKTEANAAGPFPWSKTSNRLESGKEKKGPGQPFQKTKERENRRSKGPRNLKRSRLRSLQAFFCEKKKEKRVVHTNP